MKFSVLLFTGALVAASLNLVEGTRFTRNLQETDPEDPNNTAHGGETGAHHEDPNSKYNEDPEDPTIPIPPLIPEH